MDQRNRPEPELVSVTLHVQYPNPSVQACGDSEPGETCSCSEGAGVEDTGVSGATAGVMAEMLCPVPAVAWVTFVMAAEFVLFGFGIGVGCATGEEVADVVSGVL